jgi:hypothetical protein
MERAACNSHCSQPARRDVAAFAIYYSRWPLRPRTHMPHDLARHHQPVLCTESPPAPSTAAAAPSTSAAAAAAAPTAAACSAAVCCGEPISFRGSSGVRESTSLSSSALIPTSSGSSDPRMAVARSVALASFFASCCCRRFHLRARTRAATRAVTHGKGYDAVAAWLARVVAAWLQRGWRVWLARVVGAWLPRGCSVQCAAACAAVLRCGRPGMW